MALSFVGSGTDTGGAFEAWSITLPGGIAQNDVVYVAQTILNTVNVDLDIATGGYSELCDLYANDTRDAQLAVHRKVQGATPDSTVAGSDTSASDKSATAHVWSGCDTGTPEDTATTTATAIDGGTSDPPEIITVTANAVVLAIGGTTEADTVTNPVSGYTNLSGTAFTNQGIWICSKSVASPGSENPGAYSDIAGQGTDSWAAATVAIRPAGGAATSILRQMLLHGLFVGSYA